MGDATDIIYSPRSRFSPQCCCPSTDPTAVWLQHVTGQRYMDLSYEYRHVILPEKISLQVPKNRLLTETEWRNLGVQQSRGWVHYMLHGPEPHILLFKRVKVE